MADRPSTAEINEFLNGLRSYRATIPENQQKMLDVMVVTTLNRKAAEESDVQAFWAAVNPVGPVGGVGAGGVAVNPVGPAGGYGSGVAVW